MGLPVEKRLHTIAEYLEQEFVALDRHEFHDGEILAMAGGTYRHSVLVANLIRSIGEQLRGKPCRPLDSNMRVRIPSRASYVYPDISVVCGEPVFDIDDKNQTTIINPHVVVEVLSDSTEQYDRGEKFALYRELDSMQEYVLVSQHEPMIETYFRQPEGGWLFQAWKSLTAIVALHSLQISLPLVEIYENISFTDSK